MRKTVPMVWRMLDGKAGHENQVLGLSEALRRRMAVECCDVRIVPSLRGLRSLIPGRLRPLSVLPEPDLIIGAGHATHLPMLVAQRKFGGRTIVLMRPSLPLRAFDLCLIPSNHDPQSTQTNVIITDGAINRLQPSESLSDDRGLILIGGPSRHYRWSDESVLAQVATIVTTQRETNWTIATSRRTPASFAAAWKNTGLSAVMVPGHETTPDWLPRILQRSGQVWVSSDSVSMIFEALTAGAKVGILELVERRASRVTRGTRQLTSDGRITSWSDWILNRKLTPPRQPLCEADRCAIYAAALIQPELQPRHDRASCRIWSGGPTATEARPPLIVERDAAFGENVGDAELRRRPTTKSRNCCQQPDDFASVVLGFSK